MKSVLFLYDCHVVMVPYLCVTKGQCHIYSHLNHNLFLKINPIPSSLIFCLNDCMTFRISQNDFPNLIYIFRFLWYLTHNVSQDSKIYYW